MTPEQRKHFEFVRDEMHGEPKQEDYLSKAYRLANELRRHLAIAPAPQQRTWVGLTDDDLKKHYQNNEWLEGARWAEAKLKEKST